MAQPELLVVGHVTRDRVPGGWRPGGAATYAALTAARLGVCTAVLTRAASDEEVAMIRQEVQVVRLPAEVTTEFENIYHRGRRTQRVRAVAPPITAADLPPWLAGTPLVLLGPVIGEVDASLGGAFSRSLLGVGAQGCLRMVGEDGDVRRRPWQDDAILSGATALFVSTEDAPPSQMDALVAHWRSSVPFVLVTEGAGGGLAYLRHEERRIPVLGVPEVDPTGAGDVFAAAFLVRLWRAGDPWEAVCFAAAAAACAVQGPGTAAIPTREEVEAALLRLQEAGRV